MELVKELTWSDLEVWAGDRIVSRGKNYQQQGVVLKLAQTADGGLTAYVQGTRRYAVLVKIDEDGEPESICTCPYGNDCKHAVATVLEYLAYVKAGKKVPKLRKKDDRLKQFDSIDSENNIYFEYMDQDEDNETDHDGSQEEIEVYLSGKSKKEIIRLVIDLAEKHPEIQDAILDQRRLASGKVRPMISRIRREILEISERPGWQNYWNEDGYTPDYSSIRNGFDTLLKAGHADELLSLGQELMTAGIQQVEMSHDHGETAMEISDCVPAIVKALGQSTLAGVDKLEWALNVVLKDEYDLFFAFVEYLNQKHAPADWNVLADRLLSRLKRFKSSKGSDEFLRNYERDRLSNWTIHALEQAGRANEIVPLCEKEAKKTGSYQRLVRILMEEKRLAEAEKWIFEGLKDLGEKWPGVTSHLRQQLREIRSRQKNWPAVAALHVYEFVNRSSLNGYKDCKKAASKLKAWSDVRKGLLNYLETGNFPWDMTKWPLPPTGLALIEKQQRSQYPKIDDLIQIAIYEKQPDQVLHWYDQRPKQRFSWFNSDDDDIAAAVKDQYPDRAIGIWKAMAESQIETVKPKAYKVAAGYLRKAAKLLKKLKRTAEWDSYLQELRQVHFRKRRLMEILDSLEGKPILRS